MTRGAISRSVLAAIASIAVAGCVSDRSAFRATDSLARSRTGFASAYRPIDVDTVDGPPEPPAIDGDIARLLARPLGPNDAIRVALALDPSLQAAFEELGVARADLLGATLPPNPELDLEARLGRTEQAGDEIEAHVVVDVTDVVTLPLRRAIARSELDAAQIRAAEAVLDVAFAVRRAFVDHVAALLLRDAMANVAATSTAASELAIGLFEAGNVARVDAVAHDAMRVEAEVLLAEAEFEVIDTRERLARLLGLGAEDRTFEVEPHLDEPVSTEVDLARVERRVLERSLALAASRAHLDALGRREGLARVEGSLPELRAGVSGSVADGEPAFGPAISVGIPLFHQGQGATRRYAAEFRVAVRRYEADGLAIRSSVRRARNRLESTRARVDLVRGTLLPLRARLVAETVLQYNAMQATPFQVIDARRAEIEATRLYVRTLREYWLARVAVLHLLAGGRADVDTTRPDSDAEGSP